MADRPARGKVGASVSDRTPRLWDSGAEILDWAFRTDELRALSDKGVDTLRELLGFLRSEQARDELGAIFGESFISVLRAAPREFAIVSFIAHGSILLPALLPVIVTVPSVRHAVLPDAGEVGKVFGQLIDPLAPWFAGANDCECEFCGVKESSWHSAAFRFVVRSLETADRAVAKAKKRVAAARSDPWVRGKFKEAARVGIEAQALQGLLTGMGGAVLTYRAFGGQLDGDPRDALRSLALRMQQELPRAWSLKYGSGNASFVRLEESILSTIETHAGGGRAVAPRNRLFLEWKDKEGLGPAAIRDRWNEMPQDQRRGIAPRAAARVTRPGVAKAIKRERSRRDKRKR
jgi:hypothetical protein